MATVKLQLDTRSKKKNDLYPVTLMLHHRYTSYIGVDISGTNDKTCLVKGSEYLILISNSR